MKRAALLVTVFLAWFMTSARPVAAVQCVTNADCPGAGACSSAICDGGMCSILRYPAGSSCKLPCGGWGVCDQYGNCYPSGS